MDPRLPITLKPYGFQNDPLLAGKFRGDGKTFPPGAGRMDTDPAADFAGFSGEDVYFVLKGDRWFPCPLEFFQT
jgi:hypothetical protein